MVGTNNGLLYYDKSNEEFTTIPCISNPVHDIITSPNNEYLWISTDEGIVIFDPADFRCLSNIKSGDDDRDLRGSHVSALANSRDGLVWIGMANGGINVYNPDQEQFKYLTQRQGFSDKPVWSVFLSKSHLLIGADNGLYISEHEGDLTSTTFAADRTRASEKNHAFTSSRQTDHSDPGTF